MGGGGQTGAMEETEARTVDAHGGLVVLDYGSQYTQLIARRARECQVASVLLPGDAPLVRPPAPAPAPAPAPPRPAAHPGPEAAPEVVSFASLPARHVKGGQGSGRAPGPPGGRWAGPTADRTPVRHGGPGSGPPRGGAGPGPGRGRGGAPGRRPRAGGRRPPGTRGRGGR